MRPTGIWLLQRYIWSTWPIFVFMSSCKIGSSDKWLHICFIHNSTVYVTCDLPTWALIPNLTVQVTLKSTATIRQIQKQWTTLVLLFSVQTLLWNILMIIFFFCVFVSRLSSKQKGISKVVGECVSLTVDGLLICWLIAPTCLWALGKSTWCMFWLVVKLEPRSF